MLRRMTTMAAVALALVIAQFAAAGQIGWWAFDEGTGTTAKDGSGKGNNGTLTGGATWDTGKYGKAVKLDGVDDYVQVPHSPDLCVTNEVTVTAWFNTPRTDGPNASGYQGILAKGNAPRSYSLYTTAAGYFHFSVGPSGAYIGSTSSGRVPVNEWAHVAVKVEGGQHRYFLNGVAAGVGGANAVLPGTTDTTQLVIGRTAEGAGRSFQGLIDDVRLYDVALTDQQIKDLFAGQPPMWPKAAKPNPEDGAAAVATPLLQWTAGDGAIFHDVYFGTSPELTAADLVASRQMFTMYWHVAGITPGATYYWRVDETAADGTTATGDVWSFVAQAVTAYFPQPADATGAVSPATTLSWMPGKGALKHHLYLSDNADAVAQGAAAADKGELTEATYKPTDLVGATTYYWRVDEVGVGGTVEKGAVWSFTTYILVEDFESYIDDEGGRIYETWEDGWTNGTGSTVGNVQAPFAERTIIHGGAQSMPLDYNNVNTPFYSEAERTFAPEQDWSAATVTDLSLWFRGSPVRFVDKGNGAFTVGASGHDIWDNADDFRFVYKRLNGDGSVVVKVDSLVNTNAWAKAGVMIRESLDAGSTMAYMIQSFSSGASFGWRQSLGATCGSATQTGIAAPRWVKLTRTGNAFTAQYSADGTTWTDIKDATTGQVVSTNVPMGASVYIGLCVTSHNAAATTIAEFSGAATTGSVTGAWQQVWIGDDVDRTNSAAGLYVAVTDSANKTVRVAHPDPAAANLGAWTEWRIPLSSLTGVNLARVKMLSIGVGDRNAPAADGSGRIFVDDIRVLKP